MREFASATALLGVNRMVMAGILLPTFGIFLSELVGESVELGGRLVGVTTLTGLGLGASTLLSMLATPLVGGLSDRASNRWQVAAGGLVSGVTGFGLLAMGAPLAVLAGLPLTSVASGSNQGLSTALVDDVVSRARRGRFLGILYTVGDLGSAVGPLLAYWLLPPWGIRNIYWLSAGVFGLMFLVAFRWAFWPHKKSPARKDKGTQNRS